MEKTIMNRLTEANIAETNLKENAKSILRKAYDSMDLIDVKELTVSENSSGEIEFHFEKSSEYGKVKISYSPQTFFEMLLAESNKATDHSLILPTHKDVPLNFMEDVFEETHLDIAKLLIFYLVHESLAFGSIQALLALETFRLLKLTKKNSLKGSERNAKVENILNIVNADRRKSILEVERQNAEIISAPQFIFCDIYDMSLEVWQRAKSLYKKNKSFPNALELVKMAFPRLEPDLIDKFALRGEGEPAPLAFESVSRFLNVPLEKGANETSRKRYLSESRKLRLQATSEEAQEAYKNYVLHWQLEEEIADRRRKMINDYINQSAH